MKNVIIVTGSARPNSAGNKVAPSVIAALAERSIIGQVIDVAALELPFFNDALPPAAEGFAPTDERVVAWTKLVAEADGVVMLTPEYNGGPSAIQKNAIDWVRNEWEGKPVAMIGYGWYDPSRSQAALEVSFDVVKATLVKPFAQLPFMKDLNPDGSILDEASVSGKLSQTLEAFDKALSVVA